MRTIVLAIIALVMATGCKKDKDPNQVTFTGLLKVQGITNYMYGTHTISSGDTYYSLQSSKVNLDNYKDQKVTITGNRLADYVGGFGPDLIEVTSVKR